MKTLQVKIKFDPTAVSLKELNDAVIKLGVNPADIEWSGVREAKAKA